MTPRDSRPVDDCERPRVAGKFFQLGNQKLYLRGVSYGPFGPVGREYPARQTVLEDFGCIRAAGFNCVRTYATPEPWFLDLAEEHGLLVLVGIAWEQHLAFLDNRRLCRRIEATVRRAVRRCAGRRAVLGYALGNEIPASIVRWHGARRIEHFLQTLYVSAKREDPDGLFTYVNYPTTEYLRLPFLDFCSYNVYLETREGLSRYLARLQNLAGAAPLVITELGLDVLRHGEAAQAEVLGWQVEAVFQAGAAGCVTFAWTDEWYRGGETVQDWAFGLTNHRREPRPALDTVSSSFSSLPFADGKWPRVSVIVCVRDGRSTIERCLRGVSQLRYPDLEVVVVDDGSKDGTSELVQRLCGELGFQVVTTEGLGLSAARNAGLARAHAGIVAFTDADAYPDPYWLHYLVHDLTKGGYAAAGGPNLAPPETGLIARCVASAPGWPRVVLISDREAEHIPGCNMAFRRDLLLEIGGFDTQFRTAGDDVDVCWRLQRAGRRIGYSPAALIWHYPRDTVRGYWRQQLGYGRAETLLERKWPEKYDSLGQISWQGRIYDQPGWPSATRPRIYHGVWGSSLFQSIYDQSAHQSWGLFSPWLLALYSTPEWNMVALALALLALLGLLWWPLLAALPILLVTSAIPISRAVKAASGAGRQLGLVSRRRRMVFVALTTCLHLLQPMARLAGRLGRGIRPLLKGPIYLAWPRRRTNSLWNEQWVAPSTMLSQLESELIRRNAAVARGGAFDRWDLEIQSGVTGSLRILLAQEEHPQGRQLVRLRAWPHWSPEILTIMFTFALLSVVAALDRASLVGLILGGFALLVGIRAFIDTALASGVWVDTVDSDPRRMKSS